MLTSTYYQILQSVQVKLASLGLAFKGTPAPVVVRKLPASRETIDGPLPVLAVCPGDPEQVAPASMERQAFTDYRADVVLIAAGNGATVANLDVWLNWRERIRTAFQKPGLTGAPQVYDVLSRPMTPIDRGMVSQDYDYSGLSFIFRALEPMWT